MIVWTIYDITNDKTRTKVSKICIDTGLYRVQKSAFVGNLELNRIDEMKLNIEQMINPKSDSVYIFPMCKADFEKVILLGQAFNEKLVSGTLKSLIL